MTCSPEKLASNRRNSAKSTGPKTPEGKAISRANALKHGLTGAGVVMPDLDSAKQLEIRSAKLFEELAPQSEMGAYLVQRIAVLTLRVERCHEQEVAVVSACVTKAHRDFDDAKLDEADALFDGLATNPSSHFRKLSRTEEGLRRLIDAWNDLKADLADGHWRHPHVVRMAHLRGYTADDCAVVSLVELSEAVQGRFDPQQPAPLDPEGHSRANAERLMEIITAEIEGLTAYQGTFDPSETEQARAEFVAKAQLAIAADVHQIHQYEAAAERGLFRTLKEARLVERKPTLAAQTQTARPEPSAANTPQNETSAELASFSGWDLLPEDFDGPPLTAEDKALVASILAMGQPISPSCQPVTGQVGGNKQPQQRHN